MNAKKTSKGMHAVKIVVAALATLFVVLSAGCATEAPTDVGVTPVQDGAAN